MANIRRGLSRLAVVVAFIIALPLSAILTENYYRTNTEIKYRVVTENLPKPKPGPAANEGKRDLLAELGEKSIERNEGKRNPLLDLDLHSIERKVVDAEIPPPLWKVSLFAIGCLLTILMLSYSAIMGSYFSIRWIVKGFREAPP